MCLCNILEVYNSRNSQNWRNNLSSGLLKLCRGGNGEAGPTIARTGVDPVVDIQWAGFAGDSCGHWLVRVVLILWQENIQRWRSDNLHWVLWILGKKDKEEEKKQTLHTGAERAQMTASECCIYTTQTPLITLLITYCCHTALLFLPTHP